jgi:hypothetical protein
MVKVKIEKNDGFFSKSIAKASLTKTTGDGKTIKKTATSTATSSAKTKKVALQRSQGNAVKLALELAENLIYSEEKEKQKSDSETNTPDVVVTDVSSVNLTSPYYTVTTYFNGTTNYTALTFFASNSFSLNFNTDEEKDISIICVGNAGYSSGANNYSGLPGSAAVLVENIAVQFESQFTISIGSTENSIEATSGIKGKCYAYNADGENAALFPYAENSFSAAGSIIYFGATSGGSGGNTTPKAGQSTFNVSTNKTEIGFNVPFLPTPPVSTDYNFYIGGGGGGSYKNSTILNAGNAGNGNGGVAGTSEASFNNTAVYGIGNNTANFGGGAGGANGEANWPTSSPGCVIVYFEGTIDN